MAVDLGNVRRLVQFHDEGLADEGGGPAFNGWDDADGYYDRFNPNHKLSGGLKQAIEEMIVEIETCRREHTHTATNPPT